MHRRFRVALVWALLAVSGGAASANAGLTGQALPFVDDDYPKALSEARARKLPLFIEAWAPW